MKGLASSFNISSKLSPSLITLRFPHSSFMNSNLGKPSKFSMPSISKRFSSSLSYNKFFWRFVLFNESVFFFFFLKIKQVSVCDFVSYLFLSPCQKHCDISKSNKMIGSSLIYNTSARHERHECDTIEKILILITTRMKTYFHIPIFTMWQVKDYKERNNFILRTTFWKCLVPMPKCAWKVHHKDWTL